MACYIETRRSNFILEKWQNLTGTLFNLFWFVSLFAAFLYILKNPLSALAGKVLIASAIAAVTILLLGIIPAGLDIIRIVRAYEIHDDAIAGDINAISNYLAEGGDPNVVSDNGKGDSLLFVAATARKQEIIDLLIEHGAEIDIFSGVVLGNIDVVSHYIGAANDVNVRDSDGRTLLHIAANFRAGYDMVRLLIESGSKVNTYDEISGNTPLHTAIFCKNSLSVIEILVQSGADVSLRNRQGQTPLDVAAQMGVVDIVESLKEIMSNS